MEMLVSVSTFYWMFISTVVEIGYVFVELKEFLNMKSEFIMYELYGSFCVNLSLASTENI